MRKIIPDVCLRYVFFWNIYLQAMCSLLPKIMFNFWFLTKTLLRLYICKNDWSSHRIKLFAENRKFLLVIVTLKIHFCYDCILVPFDYFCRKIFSLDPIQTFDRKIFFGWSQFFTFSRIALHLQARIFRYPELEFPLKILQFSTDFLCPVPN